MAIVKFFEATDMSELSIDEPQIANASPSRITTLDGNETEHYYGSFSYANDELSGGTVTGYDRYVMGAKTHEISGVSLSATKVASYIAGGNAQGLFSFLLGGADTFTGSIGNDVLQGFAGSDAIDGGQGVDTAVYSGLRASYTITKTASGYTVSGADGTDTLTNVEQLRFSDGTVDISATSGTGTGTGGTGSGGTGSAGTGSGGTGAAGQVGVPELVSANAAGVMASGSLSGAGEIFVPPAISGNGRYVVFNSGANNLLVGDANLEVDTFYKDMQTGEVRFVISDTSGARITPARSDHLATLTYGEQLSISDDGRYVAFSTYATNLAAGDANTLRDVYVKDMVTGTIKLASSNAAGMAMGGEHASLSADGRYLSFQSYQAQDQIKVAYVKDLTTGAIRAASVSATNTATLCQGEMSFISANGRYVVFQSSASILVPGDTNWPTVDLFRKDLQTGIVEAVSTDANGNQRGGFIATDDTANGGISADGRYVVFSSKATDLVAGDTNGVADIFYKDMQTGAIKLVSTSANGVQSNKASINASISDDGRYVVFNSSDDDLAPSSQQLGGIQFNVYIKDMQTGAIKMVNDWALDKQSANLDGSISADGSYIVLKSDYDTSEFNLAGNQIYRVQNPFLASNGPGSGTGTGTVFLGTNLSDVLNGSAGNDTITGGAGNDTLNGAGGIDIATYSGARAAYTITKTATGYTVKHNSGTDGTDTLTDIERLKFSDANLALDVTGNGGQAYRLYQAAFNRTPDQGGLGFQMKALDDGLTLTQVAQNFINSPEFNATYGSLNTTQFVTQLYQNVLHRAPDAGGLAYHTGNLDSGTNSRAQVLVGFSESPENQAALIGVIQGGMVYTV